MKKKVIASVVIILGGAVFAYYGGEFSTPDYREMAHTETAMRDSLLGLRHEVDSLTLYRDSLTRFPAVQERYAREMYGMIHPGELSFKMVPDSESPDSIRR